MIDFKKKTEEYLASLTQEERDRRALLKSLSEENTFYKSIVRLEDESGNVTREQEASVYKPVLNKEIPEVRNVLILSFGGYREYQYDKCFVQSFIDSSRECKGIRLCIDRGQEVYVNHDDLFRVFQESILVLKSLGIGLVEDYSSSLRETSMGRMLVGMGLLSPKRGSF